MKFSWWVALLVPSLAEGAGVPVPQDCSSQPFREEVEGGEVGRLALECTLSAINSQAERTNFGVIPSELTVGLTVRCSDGQSLSELEPEGFRSLVWLEDLQLRDCRLDRIPDRAFLGLTRLKSLTVSAPRLSSTPHIHFHILPLSPSSSPFFCSEHHTCFFQIRTVAKEGLSISRGAFEGLANLASLDLGDTPVHFSEKGSLCALPNLLRLNLSRSSITSLDELGLSPSIESVSVSCLRYVRHLDISRNLLTSLSPANLRHFPGLQSLDLSYNQLVRLEEGTFDMASNLATLDLSNNELVNLAPSLFSHLPLLSTLLLANNSLPSLPSSLLNAQGSQLVKLDLSGNRLTSDDIRPSLLDNLTGLLELDLSKNLIDKLKKRSFNDLTSLEILNLSHNMIKDISPKLFKNQNNMRSLSLSNNQLTRLVNDALSGLESLEQLHVDNNLLEELEEQLLAHLSRLSLLDLSRNRLLAIPQTLRFLRNLKSIDLSGNYISDLESSPNLPQLWRLNLSGNKIVNVSSTSLAGMAGLQILDMSNNLVVEIERAAFDANKQLRAIRLDSNKLSKMDSLFHQLPNLTWLNVSDNKIELFDYAMVPRNLLWLDIHKNRIQSLENYFGIDDGTTIHHIDAGFNLISQIGPMNVPRSVEIILLNDNEITEVAPYTFFEKSKLRRVDLTVNRMTGVDKKSLRLSPDLVAQPKFLLGGNPIECGCEMVWFRTINEQGNSLQSLPFIADLESIYCRLPYSREQTFAPLVDASPLDFLCSYRTHCFSLCHCCDYDACDCEMACPNPCSCYHDTTWTKNIAECSSANLTNLPHKLPMDATEIFLDGNNIGKLKSHTFIGRKNLKVIYLNNSNIESVANNTFNGVPALTILHLESNQISKLEGDEFQGLTNLRELYLQDNRISSISNITFRILANLEVLFLHGNLLVDFPAWSLTLNPYLTQLQLASNPWACDCPFLLPFLSFLSGHRAKVADYPLLSCVGNEIDGPVLQALHHNSTSCQETRQAVSSHVKDSGEEQDYLAYLPLMVITLLSVTFLMVSVLLLFIYRSDLRVWLHYKYGMRFFQKVEREEDCDKVFDAFVAYSSLDDMFVRQVLAPELELGQSQYRLCLYHRDLPALHYVADAIVQASEASRRTILVLSDSFLKQEWGRYDFRSGVVASLRSSGKRLVVILLGEVGGRDLDPELRLALKSATVIQWGEAKFWQRLRYCLPDNSACTLSQSTTLQSYPSTVQYSSPELYRTLTSPRYQAVPRGDHIYQVCG